MTLACAPGRPDRFRPKMPPTPMKSSPPASTPLHAQMADWFVRREGPDWTEADERDFVAWLRADPARRQAWRQWSTDWRAADRLPHDAAQRLRAMVQADRQATGHAAPRSPARRHFGAALALAGVAGMGTAGRLGWQRFNPAPLYRQDLATGVGQTQTAILPDGSVVHLDARTTLQVRFFADRREIHITHGQAAFEEAGDPERPFEVRTDDLRVAVIGTRFSVRQTPDVPGRTAAEVRVAEGRVRVSRIGLAGLLRPWSIEIGARQQLARDEATGQPRAAPFAADDFTPWRRPLLRFSDVPLDQAVAELQRYADLQITAVAPDARGLRLSGSFGTRDPASTRRLLEGALPIQFKPAEQGFEILLSEQ